MCRLFSAAAGILFGIHVPVKKQEGFVALGLSLQLWMRNMALNKAAGKLAKAMAAKTAAKTKAVKKEAKTPDRRKRVKGPAEAPPAKAPQSAYQFGLCEPGRGSRGPGLPERYRVQLAHFPEIPTGG